MVAGELGERELVWEEQRFPSAVPAARGEAGERDGGAAGGAAIAAALIRARRRRLLVWRS